MKFRLICGILSVTLQLPANAQVLRVDKVTIDSVWNSDSSWLNSQGLAKSRASRDLLLGFSAEGEGTVSCSLLVSLDSAKTWQNGSGVLTALDTLFGIDGTERPFPLRSAVFRAKVRQRAHLRIAGADRRGVAFKVLCRQYAPRINAINRTFTVSSSATQNVSLPLQVSIIDGGLPTGPVDKYLWDVNGDGTIEDSTHDGTTVWTTTAPSCTNATECRRGIIVTARDLNGSLSNSETMTAVFGNQPAYLASDTFVVGAQMSPMASSVDLDGPTVLFAAAAKAAGPAVDIVYAFSMLTNSPIIMSPSYAAIQSGFAAYAGWPGPSQTKFHRVSVDMSTITHRSQIATLFDPTKASSVGREAIAPADVYVVKTDRQEYVLIRAESVSADNAGTATFTCIK